MNTLKDRKNFQNVFQFDFIDSNEGFIKYLSESIAIYYFEKTISNK